MVWPSKCDLFSFDPLRGLGETCTQPLPLHVKDKHWVLPPLSNSWIITIMGRLLLGGGSTLDKQYVRHKSCLAGGPRLNGQENHPARHMQMSSKL